MNDVEELKQFAAVHARTQGITPQQSEAVLSRITTDDGSESGSWAGEWTRAAADHEAAGRLLDACRHYTMARFPFVDGPAREHALRKAVETFGKAGTGLERLDVGGIRCYAKGLGLGKPAVILLGGIVSIKEQWAPLLLQLGDLGFAGIVTELPQAGENTLPYDEHSWQMFSTLIDAIGADEVYAMAMSFAGHLALRCATTDKRIKGVLTVGAPTREFFTDQAWRAQLPRVTVDTLAHLTGGADLGGWGLTEDELSSLDIPVAYVASTRDEIIPPADISLLRTEVTGLQLLENDDVHGSPEHTQVTGPWLVAALRAMRDDLREDGQ